MVVRRPTSRVGQVIPWRQGISPHPKLRHDYGGDAIILAAGAQDPSTVSDKYE